MSPEGEFFVRWRVRLGYPLAIAVLWFSQPTPRSVLFGATVGVLGLWLRAYAAGYLHKQEVLTVTGPYSHTRNPLYLGSAILALGVGIAAKSLLSAVILVAYFAVFYSMVMRREEAELRAHHGAALDEYARAVPIFLPHLRRAKLPSASPGAFSIARYRENHEWRAAAGYLFILAVLLVIWRLRLH